MNTDGRDRATVAKRRDKRGILTSFDYFVALVVLGYLLVVVQGMWQGGSPMLPFTPSSQLRDERNDLPTEISDSMAVSARALKPRLIEIE